MEDWWKEIDESKQWQKAVFYSLCASYATVACVALVICLFSLLVLHSLLTMIRKIIRLSIYKYVYDSDYANVTFEPKVLDVFIRFNNSIGFIESICGKANSLVML